VVAAAAAADDVVGKLPSSRLIDLDRP